MICILTVKDIDDESQQQVIDLYRASFPHKERDSIHRFLKHDGNEGRILTFYDGVFIGFAALIIYKDIVNILYLAISKDHQSHGYGHQVLEEIKKMYPGHRFIVDIEKDEENCPNHLMRKRRELFYLHDDYSETGIEYMYRNVDYLIMSAGGQISKTEFKEFWTHFAKVDDLGHFVATHFSC